MDGKLEVVIAGGGVAGLEAAFALQALAAQRVNVTLLSAEARFRYRPLGVSEPFTDAPALDYSLAEIVAAAGAEHVADSFRWLDPGNRMLHTRRGRELGYDAVLLALGARPGSHFKHALTLEYTRLAEHLAALIGELEQGRLRTLAALIPSRTGWPLPVYELCLRLARAARERDAELEITLATQEEAPLEWFGSSAAKAVAELLDEAGIVLHTGVSCEAPAPGLVSFRPGLNDLEVDCVIASPQLYGPSTPGVPKRARGGFVSVDSFCRVREILGVYAAGDATDFPVKFGAVAGQQADTAAAGIAAAAGADVEPAAFQPVIEGSLLGGARPLYMSAHLMGSHAHRSQVARGGAGHPARLAARYLAAYLDSPERAAASG